MLVTINYGFPVPPRTKWVYDEAHGAEVVLGYVGLRRPSAVERLSWWWRGVRG